MAAPFLHVTVTEPTKHPDTFGSYMSYKINTTTNLSEFDFGEFSVVRRFNDFVWLSEQLAVSCPGAIIPACPDKQTVGRFSPDFIEARRRAMESFLTRVAAHPQLVYSPRFVSFLQADDATLAQVKVDCKNNKKKAAGNPIDWLQSLTVSGKGELEKTPADMKFEEIAQYVATFEGHLATVSKNATALVVRNRKSATSLFEVGQSFTWLGQSEGDSFGTALSEVGTAADTLSQSGTKLADDELIQLDEPLQEYVRLTASLKVALNRRHEKKIAYINAINDLENKQGAYNKVLGVPGKEEATATKLQAVDKAQSTCDDAKDTYEKVTDELVDDFERFKVQKASDMQKILLNYVSLQIEHHKQCEATWDALIPTLQDMHDASSSGNPFDDEGAVVPPIPPYQTTSKHQEYDNKPKGDMHDIDVDDEDSFAGV